MAERTSGKWEVSGPYVRLADTSKAIVAHVLKLHGDEGANAEYIVRAVNAHDDLLAAAEAALTVLEAPISAHTLPDAPSMLRAAIEAARA